MPDDPETNAATLRPQVEAEAEALRDRLDRPPAVAVVAEAGLPALEGELQEATQHPFGEALGPPAAGGATSEAETLHAGTLAEGVPVALMQARSLEAGFTAREAALTVRVLATLGAEAFVLLGRAAPLADRLRAGCLLLVTDHLNFQGDNPLTGANEDDWGARFPDMSAPYDADWRAAVQAEIGAAPGEGIYAAAAGPATPAEQAMLRRMGADAVGTGLVPEVIAAGHMGRRVLGAVQIAAPRAEATNGRDGAAPMAELTRVAVRQATGPRHAQEGAA
jgi:purine-nucleoside phosphorylase